MRLIRKSAQFLLAVIILFLVIWPVLSLFFLSLLGVALLFIPQITEAWAQTTADAIWPGFLVGLSVIIGVIAARRFLHNSYSLKRLTVFAVLVYPLALLTGVISRYALAFVFDFSSMQLTDIGSTTATAVFSLLVFMIACGLSYLLVYQRQIVSQSLRIHKNEQ